VKNYWRLLNHAGVARVLFSQLLARFPYGMVSIAFVIQIQHSYHSYALAGLVIGAETVGVGISGPVLGRWLSRFGVRRVLLTCALTSAVSLIVLAFVHLPPIAVVVLASISGLLSPPIQAAARTTYPTLIAEEQHTLLFGLDATLQEIIWIFGPIVATLIASQISPEIATLTLSVILVLGVFWFLSNPEVTRTRFDRPSGKLGRVLKNPVVLASAVMGFLLVGSFAGVEVGIVGVFTHDRAMAGLVISTFSIGSIVGGLIFSQINQTKKSFAVYAAILTVGFALTMVAPTSAVWLSICLIIAGLGVAPFLGMLAAVISFSLSSGETSEAFGWVNTGQMVGYSLAAALTGVMIDVISAPAALLVSVGFAFATFSVAVATIAITPQLPGHNKKVSKQPQPATESSTK
jgi:MFS family permease